MKIKIKQLLIVGFISFSSAAVAQFNTLTHSPKIESFPKNENLKIEKNEKEENAERKQKKIFRNTTTKADLKSEIDSLKNLMLRYSLSHNEEKKINYKKIEDSLIQMITEKFSNSQTPGTGRSIKRFSFVNEDHPISKIEMPLKSKINVTSPFGTRVHPIFGKTKMHNGVDFKANYEPVLAVMEGYVTEAGWDSKGGGNYIKIKHSNSFVTAYLHLSEIYYKVGEYVKAGYTIAKSGNSGNSTGPHLHFSVKENGNYINPIHFLNDLVKANNLIATYYAK